MRLGGHRKPWTQAMHGKASRADTRSGLLKQCRAANHTAPTGEPGSWCVARDVWSKRQKRRGDEGAETSTGREEAGGWRYGGKRQSWRADGWGGRPLLQGILPHRSFGVPHWLSAHQDRMQLLSLTPLMSFRAWQEISACLRHACLTFSVAKRGISARHDRDPSRSSG